jgi:hypothetical protein
LGNAGVRFALFPNSGEKLPVGKLDAVFAHGYGADIDQLALSGIRLR